MSCALPASRAQGAGLEHGQDSELSWPKGCATPQNSWSVQKLVGAGQEPPLLRAGHQSAGRELYWELLFPLGVISLSLEFSLQLEIVVGIILFSLLTCSYLNPQSSPDSMLLGGTEIMG